MNSDMETLFSFNRLAADVAARFSVIEPDGVDEALVDALRQTGEALHLDQAVLWQRASNEPTAVPSHYWFQRPGARVPEPVSIASISSLIAGLDVGVTLCFGHVDELPEGDRDLFRRCGFRSGAVVPMPSTEEDGVMGALAFGSAHEQTWVPAVVERLRLIAGVMGQGLARKASHVALQRAQDEIRRLRDRLPQNDVERRHWTKAPQRSNEIVADSAAMQEVFIQLEQVAPTPATVLLLGETGSGKDVMAQAIHDMSPRRQRQMIKVSCAAIPTTLVESELFGHERGAYTGALTRQIGRFEVANGSTLFLDEIGELPMEVQVKLLRVLQDRVIERLGSTQSIMVDVRIIAATNRNLEDAVRDKTFREDLFYRLNVFPVAVPPLRDHVEDIPALVCKFVDEFSKSFGKRIDAISKDCLRELQRYPWPGNVRELRNLVERAVIVATGPQLTIPAPRADFRLASTQTGGSQGGPGVSGVMTLGEMQGDHIRAVLESTNWRVRGAGGAAERLGMKPTTLESRMARLGIFRKNPTRLATAS